VLGSRERDREEEIEEEAEEEEEKWGAGCRTLQSKAAAHPL